MNGTVVFQSRYFLLWIFAITGGCFVPLLKHRDLPSWQYCLVSLILIYITGNFTLQKFTFYTERIEKFRPLSFFRRTRIIRYSDLYAIEIREIKASYQQPYIILHIEKRKVKSWNFIGRSFVFDRKKDDLKPLTDFLQEHSIRLIETK